MQARQNLRIILLCILLTGGMLLHFTGCSAEIKAADLMEGIKAGPVAEKAADEAFLLASADFAAALFRNISASGQQENPLVSPLSAMLALAMTANGADTQTKAEMEKVLGGSLPIEELNEYLHTYVKNLPSREKSRLEIANSIWFRADEGLLQVNSEFLQKNADYYNAAAYQSAFDSQTVKDINCWIEKNTDGMIDKIIEELDSSEMLYLINALVFDAEWETPYQKHDVVGGTFTRGDGTACDVQMMRSCETKYIRDENAVGFIKNYKGGKYGFAALLPDEAIPLEEYAASLSGARLLSVFSNAESASVDAWLPKFSCEYSAALNDALAQMGMSSAFSSETADFTRLGSSSLGNLYIGKVIHKTFISVSELGTRAGAASAVSIEAKSAPMYDYTVKLDRPFVYAIIDNAANLPIFLGTMQIPS